ncbi:DNA polymerase I [Eubacterium sp. F2]|uniref:DNA polymerase I n=1 Tax=Eubacterium sp. F2 TaxID=3381348 RepID=UPI003908417E
MEDRIVIIDGNSLINRAYYAMQRPMITADGVYTQGIFGFLNMLWKILDDVQPGYAAVAWDRKTPTFRHKSYDGYKAGRKAMPAELAMELPYMKKILTAMDIKNLEIDGFEADDILGTVSKEAEEEGLSPLIITGDKDALQLASDKTQVMITKKGISEFDLYDDKKMMEVYGLTPRQFIDLKGLMGDKSDNIPGIPGVGQVTGLKLMKQFGSIENLLQHTDEIKGAKLREKIEDNVQQVVMSRRLAEIVRNVPLDIDVKSDLKTGNPDTAAMAELFQELELKTFLKRMADRGLLEQDTREERTYKTIRIETEEQLSGLDEIPEGSEIWLLLLGNDDHVGMPKEELIALMYEDKYYVIDPALESSLIELLNRKHFRFAGHDLIRAYYPLMRKGLREFSTAFDTQIAQYVLDPSRKDYFLSSLALEYLQITLPDSKKLEKKQKQITMFPGGLDDESVEYGKHALDAAVQLRELQEKKLDEENGRKLAEEIEFPLIRVLAQMEVTGIPVDAGVLQEIGSALKEETDKLEQAIYTLAGEEFNINSTQQLGEILFEKLGLPAGKKTKRGYSTSAEVLKKLEKKYPIASLILQYRTLTKLQSTYVEGLVPLIGEDGKIRAHFQQTVTATGRLSCTEPNLQNIPVRTDIGRQLRRAFTAEKGGLLVGADYSQIELRILAHMSGDENLIRAFNEGEDIHRTTAARVFNVDYEDVTPLQRSRAKAVNFGVIYGMSSFGLSEEIHVSRKEAESYIQDYFAKHPKVKIFMDACIEQCREKGYSETLFGRRRYIREIKSKNYMSRQLGERLAMNSPIQGTAADIIKIAMIRVEKELRERKMKSRLVLQIHDELIIQTDPDEREQVEELLQRNMENAAELKVALLCDRNEGTSWYELKD